jgi:chromosome segregation ATPase
MAMKIEDVVNAAQELEKQGTAVTNQTVRKHLGDVGSFTTINTGLRQWRDIKNEQRREGQKDFVLTIEEVLDLPAISKAALQYVRKEYESESAAAQARVDAVEIELERAGDRIDGLDKALSDSEEMSKKWREENEVLVRKAAVLEERLTNMATRMEGLEKQLEQAVEGKAVAERAHIASEARLKLVEGECASAQARADVVEMDLERSGIRIDTLEKDLRTSEETNKKWREWNEELVRKAAVLEERLTNMTTRLEGLEKQVEQAVEARAVAERALISSKEKLKLAEGECASAQARVDAVEMDMERSGIRIDTLEKDLRTSEETNKKWGEWNEELVRKAAVLEERLTNMTTRLEGLEKQVDQAVEAKAVAERTLFSYEERLKLADEQVYQQKVQIKELEKGDEAVEETAEVSKLALKRVNQVSRLMERLKLEHDDKSAVEKMVAEIQAVADRHKTARKPVKS